MYSWKPATCASSKSSSGATSSRSRTGRLRAKACPWFSSTNLNHVGVSERERGRSPRHLALALPRLLQRSVRIAIDRLAPCPTAQRRHDVARPALAQAQVAEVGVQGLEQLLELGRELHAFVELFVRLVIGRRLLPLTTTATPLDLGSLEQCARRLLLLLVEHGVEPQARDRQLLGLEHE